MLRRSRRAARRPMLPWRAGCALALLPLAVATASLRPAELAAQARSGPLPPSNGALDDGFTRITGIRELRDGRLLVADQREVRLHLVDWRTRGVREVGAEGSGPGEFRSIHRLFALGGDTTLMGDSRNGRWLVLDGDRMVGSIDYGRRHQRPLPPDIAGADRRGRLLITVPTHLRTVPGLLDVDERGRADSLLLVLEHAHSGRADTLMRIRGSFRGLREVLRPPLLAGTKSTSWLVRNPLAAEEQAQLYPDGWIALALTDPYRVDWITPEGRRIRGAPLPFTAVPVDERQKAAAVARRYQAGTKMRVADMPPDWPRVLPPFLNDALLAAPGGQLVIRRTLPAGATAVLYDVVDRRGALVRTVSLPLAQRLIGFGAASAYTVTTDGDDLQWLQRHPWP